MKPPRLLLLTPPFVQVNTPYPATMHLTGYLRSRGFTVFQRDLSIKVARDVLIEYGGDEAEELLETLSSSNLPDEAKLEPSKLIDDLAIEIRDQIDESFGFSRYAERISAQAADFGEVEKLVRRRGVMDKPLERRLEEALAETQPTVVGVTCPFPGTLVGAFKIARYLKKHYPDIFTILGGGFVSTELREMNDPRPHKYFDRFLFDEGYSPMETLLSSIGQSVKSIEESKNRRIEQFSPVPPFVAPSYDGIDWGEYFDVVETENPMHRLWSVGRWRKLIMARGCYWHRCAFCDVKLPYINCFEMPSPTAIVDAIESLSLPIDESTNRQISALPVHFVDEAMPPSLIRKVSEEIIRRGLNVEWWGNVRFDSSFTLELTRLMAKAGCIAVTGGLECANDRLLKLMNKGITLASAKKSLGAFKRAGIMVHAYLMYGFPTETAEEAYGALEFARDLIRDDLVQSAFWHRFALTVHSPIAHDPEAFGIKILPPAKVKRLFCRNEIAFDEPSAPDWDRIGRILKTAMFNYLERRGLDKPISFWLRKVK